LPNFKEATNLNSSQINSNKTMNCTVYDTQISLGFLLSVLSLLSPMLGIMCWAYIW
jgi:hypothetical protein